MDHIVVGVDRSASGRRALAVAADEARRRGARISAVTCWLPSYCNGYESTPGLTDAAAALQAQDEAVAELGPPPCPIARVIVRGRPANTLAELARDADLLVVGAGDRRWWARLVWGSLPRELAQRTRTELRVVEPAQPSAAPAPGGVPAGAGPYAMT